MKLVDTEYKVVPADDGGAFIYLPCETYLYSPARGRVWSAGDKHARGGKYVVIDYCAFMLSIVMLSEVSGWIKEGAEVDKGDWIGTAGVKKENECVIYVAVRIKSGKIVEDTAEVLRQIEWV